MHIFFYLYLVGSFSFYLANASAIDEKNQTTLCQQHLMTLKEIMALLKQQPCILIEKQFTNSIRKRDVNNGNLDIHAIQTTINDHRTMINYLVNNSINATYVSDAISTYHSKTGPIFTSWRDLVDLFFITLFLGFIIYYIMCRAGFAPCDKLLQCLFKPVVQRVQQQQQQQQTEPTAIIDMDMSRRNKQQQQQPIHSSISDDFIRYNTGYVTD